MSDLLYRISVYTAVLCTSSVYKCILSDLKAAGTLYFRYFSVFWGISGIDTGNTGNNGGWTGIFEPGIFGISSLSWLAKTVGSGYPF